METSLFSFSNAELSAIYLSITVGIWSVLISLPFGIFFAWLLARKNFIGKSIIDGLLHLPLVLPPVVMGYLLLITFGKKGIIGSFLYEYFGISFAFNWKGAVLASAVMAFPLLVRSIRLSIESVDIGLENAAKTLGKHPFIVFLTITLPLIIPGIISGMVLSFARSLGEFGATITFVSNIPGETATLPITLYSLIQIPGEEYAATKLCAISIIIALLALIISEYIARRSKKALG